jgi:hypothetical protein
MSRKQPTVRVVWEASSSVILLWCVASALLSLITLGLYLPIALNNLVKYLCDCTEVQIHQNENRVAIAKAQELEREKAQAAATIEAFERRDRQAATRIEELEREKKQAAITIQALEREYGEQAAVIAQVSAMVSEALNEGTPADIPQLNAFNAPAKSPQLSLNLN